MIDMVKWELIEKSPNVLIYESQREGEFLVAHFYLATKKLRLKSEFILKRNGRIECKTDDNVELTLADLDFIHNKAKEHFKE